MFHISFDKREAHDRLFTTNYCFLSSVLSLAIAHNFTHTNTHTEYFSYLWLQINCWLLRKTVNEWPTNRTWACTRTYIVRNTDTKKRANCFCCVKIGITSKWLETLNEWMKHTRVHDHCNWPHNAICDMQWKFVYETCLRSTTALGSSTIQFSLVSSFFCSRTRSLAVCILSSHGNNIV